MYKCARKYGKILVIGQGLGLGLGPLTSYSQQYEKCEKFKCLFLRKYEKASKFSVSTEVSEDDLNVFNDRTAN